MNQGGRTKERNKENRREEGIKDTRRKDERNN